MMRDDIQLPTTSPPQLPPDLLVRVKGAVAQAPPGPRARLHVRRMLGLVVPLAVVLVAAALTWRDFHSLPMDQLVFMTSEVALLAVVSIAVVTSTGKRGLGASLVLLVAVGALVAPLYAVATLIVPLHPVIADIQPPPVSESMRTGLSCAAFGSAMGGLVLAALSYSLRRAVPAATVARGCALGAAAGASAGLALHLFCPHFDRLHLLVGHVLPIVVFTAIGALATPRLLRP